MDTLMKNMLRLAQEGETISDPERVTLSSVATNSWTVVDSNDAELIVESDITLMADRTRLQQLLENLLRNAVEHGDSGVTIRVGSLPDAAGFYVADDGPGIPKEKREDVFEWGYSTGGSGTGLGLAIVEEIVDAHRWDIDVTGSEDQGARFEITGVESSD
jgi:signal transduction histidine kinase